MKYSFVATAFSAERAIATERKFMFRFSLSFLRDSLTKLMVEEELFRVHNDPDDVLPRMLRGRVGGNLLRICG